MRELTVDEVLFFGGLSGALPLYCALAEELRRRFPQAQCRVQKTQISCYDGCMFACVSLPRRKKDCEALMITLALAHKLESGRLFAASEPYPGRWTNHILIKEETEMDGAFWAWVEEAHAFALSKRKRA